MTNRETLVFSVVIPTYRRPARLRACLSALAQLKYSADKFEVIVVDDGGGSLQDIVATFESSLRLMCLQQCHRGPASARNLGALVSRAPFLAFTDDDCEPFPDWLLGLQAQCAVAPNRAVGGRLINGFPTNVYSAASHLILDHVLGYYGKPGRPSFLTTANLAVHADHFWSIGGFDERYTRAGGEDRDFCDRWLRQGFEMIYTPEAKVRHCHWLTLRGFWEQQFGYGRGAHRFHATRANRGLAPVMPDLGFYWGLLTRSFRSAVVSRALTLEALVVLSQLANAAGILHGALSERVNGRSF